MGCSEDEFCFSILLKQLIHGQIPTNIHMTSWNEIAIVYLLFIYLAGISLNSWKADHERMVWSEEELHQTNLLKEKKRKPFQVLILAYSL